MLFMVISTPAPTSPSSVRDRRQQYWKWAQPLRESGKIRSIYARVGRGAVALMDVDSLQTLHRYLNEWADIIPAEFQVLPLIDTDAAQAFLAQQGSERLMLPGVQT